MANFDDVFSGRPFTMRLVVTPGAQNTAANTTSVAWALRVIKTASYTTWTTSNGPWSINIGGQTSSGTWDYDFRSVAVGDYITISSGTKTITHNSDGTKTISVSASATGAGEIGSASKSGSLALPSIARASIPTFEQGGIAYPSVEAGTVVDIITNRASSSFTHDMSYSFGSTSGFIGSGIGASTSWTVPLSLLSQIPDSYNGAVQIITDTYNGGTLVGSRTVSLTITVPASGGPSLIGIATSDATTVPDVADLIGGYVKGLSALNIEAVGAAGYYGSYITYCSIQFGPHLIVGTSGTTPVLTEAGEIPVVVTLTDSRATTRTFNMDVTVLDYTPPTIVEATAVRATGAGVPAEAGTYIRVDLEAVVRSLIVGTQRNELSYRIRVRERTDTTPWASITPSVEDSVGSTGFNDDIVWGTYPISESFTVRIEVYDVLGTTSTVQIVVPTGGVQVHFSKTVDGIGVGKYHEFGSIDAAEQIYQLDGQRVLDETDLLDASDTVKGIVELATSAETQTGTDTTRAVTPAGLSDIMLQGYRFSERIIYDTPGTFSFSKTSYPHIRGLLVKVQGAGGGGGGAAAPSSGQHTKGGGGGAGGYSEFWFDAAGVAAMSSPETVIVGAGGTASSGAAGGNGGLSRFGFSVNAGGGQGGGIAASGALTTAAQGGEGGVTTFTMIPGQGESGQPGTGGATLGIGGSGGNSRYGAGGRAAYQAGGSASMVGYPAQGYGGGGGGAQANAGSVARAGGVGGQGVVIVEVYV